MSALGAVAAIVIAVALIGFAMDSMVRTFLIPRGLSQPLTRWVFRSIGWLFRRSLRFAGDYETRDKIMAWYGPITLLLLPILWMAIVLIGFGLLFVVAVPELNMLESLEASGSSLFTLGFVRPENHVGQLLAFTESAIGLTLLALVISYIPTIYGAFSRREVSVAMLSYRAGNPPSASDLLIRAHRIGTLTDLNDLWTEWQRWFAELEETHTSLAVLNFFRSPDPNRSWITASGTVLDAAALHMSVVAVPFQPMAGLCIRSGFMSLRAIGTFFRISYETEVSAATPISVSRAEFDGVVEQLRAAGLPIKMDPEAMWTDFCGWRANYDAVVVGLASAIAAPYAAWVSDRSIHPDGVLG